jgi:hypothetical protein
MLSPMPTIIVNWEGSPVDDRTIVFANDLAMNLHKIKATGMKFCEHLLI